MSYKKTLQNRSGLSLLEISLAVLIAGFVGVSITTLLMGTLDGWSRGTSKAYSQGSVNVAAQKVAQEIREGQSAMVTSGRLVVTLPLKTTDGLGETYYTRGSNGVSRQYYYDGNTRTLKRSVNGTVSTVLTRISNAAFSVSGKNVTITVYSDETVGDSARLKDDPVKRATATVQLRN